MAKEKKVYTCISCGVSYAKWQGQCSSCHEWNTLQEETVYPSSSASKSVDAVARIVGSSVRNQPTPLHALITQEEERLDLHDGEFNRVLGGGLVRGSFTLLGGEPGIGKSTLILQTVLRLPNIKTLYVSGEESEHQLKMRADRLGGKNSEVLIYCATSLEDILEKAQALQSDLLVIDSIQTTYTQLTDSSPGSPTQIRESANLLLRYAKVNRTAVIVIGHINKEGSIAGPKVLEHTVDTVLQFEGDKHFLFRILRGSKNRFGSTNELGIYEMRSDGLKVIDNPSELLISQNMEGLSGRSVAVALEGVRPLLIETQALVSSAIYANPQRSATGFDLRRMNMLLAVLEKRAGFKLIKQDVFLNIAGGIRISDPAVDLSVLVAVLSSVLDRAIPGSMCFSGEIGLSGELRAVSRIEQRIAEAERIGFTDIVIPSGNASSIDPSRFRIRIHGCSNTEEALRTIFQSS